MRFRPFASLLLAASVASLAYACGGATVTPDGTSSGSSSSSGSSGASSSGSSGASSSSSGSSGASSSSGNPGRTPKNHRAVANACDGTRPATEPTNIPDAGATPNGYIQCTSNAECTAGTNGRCVGNGHDGWRCTYDACSTDAECGPDKVCECEGGFRSDNDVCVASNCRVDADCGAGGFCSPTLGSCGHYGKTNGYYCHTPQDECIDDEDCGADAGSFGQKPYCRYEPSAGRWTCSTQECAG